METTGIAQREAWLRRVMPPVEHDPAPGTPVANVWNIGDRGSGSTL